MWGKPLPATKREKSLRKQEGGSHYSCDTSRRGGGGWNSSTLAKKYMVFFTFVVPWWSFFPRCFYHYSSSASIFKFREFLRLKTECEGTFFWETLLLRNYLRQKIRHFSRDKSGHFWQHLLFSISLVIFPSNPFKCSYPELPITVISISSSSLFPLLNFPCIHALPFLQPLHRRTF